MVAMLRILIYTLHTHTHIYIHNYIYARYFTMHLLSNLNEEYKRQRSIINELINELNIKNV